MAYRLINRDNPPTKGVFGSLVRFPSRGREFYERIGGGQREREREK